MRILYEGLSLFNQVNGLISSQKVAGGSPQYMEKNIIDGTTA